ncbi:MAG: hypothetical protein QXR68_08610, partial [Pyrobaculum sp.]
IRGQENYCPHAISKMPGLLGLDGGHAEFMAVPETAVFPIPPGVDVYTAAAVACAYGTAYRALKEANVGPGVSIVVVGAGGVGLAAVELANALGAIVAIDIRDAALAKRWGLHTSSTPETQVLLQKLEKLHNSALT